MLAVLLACVALQSAPAESGPGWARFPVLIYRQAWAGREAPAEVVEPFGGVHVRGAEEAAWVQKRGLDFYVEHSAGRDSLHLDRDARWKARWERWKTSRDDALLVREPCLTDPRTREHLFAELEQSLAARAGAWGLGYSLGDEVGLTTYGAPEDVCLSPTCKAAWRAFLRERELLTRAQARGFDELASVSTDRALARFAAGDTRVLEGWLLRRAFHRGVVLELLRELAARIRKARPEAPIGLMGLIGDTAFGGVSVEGALGCLDFVEPYRVGVARESCFTARGASQRALCTVFLDSKASAYAAWQAWEHWLHGGDGLVVWCDRDLGADPPSRARLAEAVVAIRGLPKLDSRPFGVALLHSADSIAANWLLDAEDDGKTWPNRLQGYQEQHGRLERDRRAWLQAFEDLGVLPGALELSAVDAQTAQRFPLLVAARLCVVDADGARRLEQFVRAGGALVLDDDFARFDPQGVPFDPPLVERLRAVARARVHSAPKGWRERALAREASLGQDLEPWLGSARALRPPFEIACARDPHWLRVGQREAEGWLCAAVQAPARPVQESRNLHASFAEGAELQVEVRCDTSWSVEPLWPASWSAAGSVKLRPGEAVVFRLRSSAR